MRTFVIVAMLMFISSECFSENNNGNNLREKKYSDLLKEDKIDKYNFGLHFANNVYRNLFLAKKMRRKNKEDKQLINVVEKFLVLDIADYWFFGEDKVERQDACWVYSIFQDYHEYIDKYQSSSSFMGHLDPQLTKNYNNALLEVEKYKERFSCDEK